MIKIGNRLDLTHSDFILDYGRYREVSKSEKLLLTRLRYKKTLIYLKLQMKLPV